MTTTTDHLDLEPLFSCHYADVHLRPLICSFVSKLSTRHEALQTAWNGQDRPGLAILAHQLKGAAGGYGFPAISEAAGQIETLAKDPHPAGQMEVLLNDLGTLCRRAALAHAVPSGG